MKKNTYIFQLKRNDFTKEQTVRIESLAEAKAQLEDDLDAGWTVKSVTENGKPVQSAADNGNEVSK